jgi:hypothetical protein
MTIYLVAKKKSPISLAELYKRLGIAEGTWLDTLQVVGDLEMVGVQEQKPKGVVARAGWIDCSSLRP